MTEIFLAAIPLVLLSLVGCENKPAVSATPPEGELLRKAAVFIEAEKNFSVAVDIAIHLEVQDQKRDMNSSYLLSVARPNRLAIRPKEGDEGLILVVDGKQFSRGISFVKQYVVGDAPAVLNEIFRDPIATYLGEGMGPAFFHALLSEHVYEELKQGVTETTDGGTEEIDGHACRQLHCLQNAFDWDIWIDTSAQPLIRKVAFLLKKPPEAEGRRLPDMKMTITYNLHDWKLDPKFSEDEFVFAAPEGWKKVDSFSEGEPVEEGPHPNLGKPAPDFELEKRGGGKADLAQHRDKDVVILDFWATWCGPCVRALPTIAKVAAKYRDRGVAFYAVDIGEGPDEVEKFLKAHDLDIPAIFDSDGAVAGLYHADGIPQTVLIGKDGKVQVVHVGLLPDLETRLSKELDDLLAGKDLTAEEPKAEDNKAEDKKAEEPEADEKKATDSEATEKETTEEK